MTLILRKKMCVSVPDETNVLFKQIRPNGMFGLARPRATAARQGSRICAASVLIMFSQNTVYIDGQIRISMQTRRRRHLARDQITSRAALSLSLSVLLATLSPFVYSCEYVKLTFRCRINQVSIAT